MRAPGFTIVLLLLLFSCRFAGPELSNENIVARLEVYHEKENFFKLKTYFEQHLDQLSEKDQLFYLASIQNAFNEHDKSTATVEKALDRHLEEYSPEELYFLHKTKYINHYNQYMYAEALRQCDILMSDYKDVMDSVKYLNLVNDRKVLTALKNAPAQEIEKHGNSWIDMHRDRLNLLNISLEIQGDSIDFLFDTGSSFSFIRRSIAEKYGMEIHDVDFEVEGATGQAVNCDITLLDSFSMGNIKVRNALFWVFDDKDLTVPRFNYSVNGALAFPIIRSLEEVHYIFGSRLFIPAFPVDYGLANMALDDHDPVVAIYQDGDTLPYFFDTGSSFTSLYSPYYQENAAYIDSTFRKETFHVGSIGGEKEFTTYIVDSIELSLADKTAWINSVETYTEYIYKDHEKVYGNLGQDFLLQFEKMIISSKYSSLLLE